MSDRMKIRVWDFEKKEWCYGVDFHALDGDPKTIHLVGRYPKKIIQCTGMKDKNGQLIFEGDILKTYGKELFSVEWMEDSYYPLDCSGEYGEFPDEVEVIGNIFENPKMLLDE